MNYPDIHTCSVSSEQLELLLLTIQALNTCSVNSEQLELRLSTIQTLHVHVA